MEPLLEGLLRSLGGSEANFLELCFGRFPYGNFHTKATSKKFRPPSGNFRPNPPELPRSPSMSFSSREAGWRTVLNLLTTGRWGKQRIILGFRREHIYLWPLDTQPRDSPPPPPPDGHRPKRFIFMCLFLSQIWFKRTCRAELKVTHLRWRSPISGFLRFSAKIFGFLRKSAVFCALQMLEILGEGVNLRKYLRFSAKICVLRALCHLSSVTLSSPWTCFLWGNLIRSRWKLIYLSFFETYFHPKAFQPRRST